MPWNRSNARPPPSVLSAHSVPIVGSSRLNAWTLVRCIGWAPYPLRLRVGATLRPVRVRGIPSEVAP